MMLEMGIFRRTLQVRWLR